LGKSFDEFVELNFELASDAKPIFDKNLDPERILRELSVYCDKKIIPGKTLLFFDEIQEAPKAIIALRYFYEMMPDLHIIAAGSLFDFALEKVGLPVGRVSSIYLYPLSFMEFLSAINNSHIIKSILENDIINEPFSEVVHQKIMNLVGEFFAIGGMPEAVAKWIEFKNPKESFQKHHDLISSYRQDFEKYADKHQIKFLDRLFSHLPRMIGQQFQYKNIHGDFRKRELAPCLDLLVKANVIHRIHHSAGNGIPLGAEVNFEWFKIILVDIALCQAILGFDLSTWFAKPGIEFVNRGAITEAFVGQELLCYSHPFRKTELFFWRRAAKSSVAEVDFLYEYKNKIVPIEVKCGHRGSLKSLNLFLKEFSNIPLGIRFSSQNYSIYEKIDSRPLYSVVSLAHEDQKESIKYLI